jgi:hypothetical protein
MLRPDYFARMFLPCSGIALLRAAFDEVDQLRVIIGGPAARPYSQIV